MSHNITSFFPRICDCAELLSKTVTAPSNGPFKGKVQSKQCGWRPCTWISGIWSTIRNHVVDSSDDTYWPAFTMHLILALPNGNHRCKVWACMDYALDSSDQFNTLLSTDSTIFREIHWHISFWLTQRNKGEISNSLLNPLDDFVLSSSQKSPWTCAYSAIPNLEDVRQENTPRSTQSISVWHGQGWFSE